MNWVWPISPAQAPRIPRREIAALDDAQRIHQLGAELVGAAAIIGQRRQRANRREFPGVDAEIRLQSPDRDQHLAGHAIGLLDAASTEPYCFSMLAPRVSRGGTMRPENSSKLWLNTFCE